MALDWTGEAAPGRPYWWDGMAEVPSDDLPQNVDLLVIGGGYTGLSAARVAADAGASVAVLEAGRPGEGASTRNGGMFGAHPRLSWEALAKQFGPDTADGVFQEAQPAFDWVRDLILDEGIECDFAVTGRIQLAYTAAHFERQRALAAKIQETSDVSVELRARDALQDDIATPLYHGGLVFRDHAALHPAKFHAGLLAAVRQRGVPVVSHCPVTDLQPGFTATTPKGPITAKRVVLATGGYTPRTFRYQQRRVFPLPSYLIATETLPANLLGHLAPGRRMMVETRARHSYFRLSPDGTRILFGGRAAMVPIPLERAAERLRATLVEIWPELSDAALSHVWTGNTGYSFTHMPQVGVQDGVHYAMGFSGSGTVMAPYLGAKAAWQALGDPRGETAYSNTALRPSWMHRFASPWFLYPADVWYHNAVDRLERRAARR